MLTRSFLRQSSPPLPLLFFRDQEPALEATIEAAGRLLPPRQGRAGHGSPTTRRPGAAAEAEEGHKREGLQVQAPADGGAFSEALLAAQRGVAKLKDGGHELRVLGVQEEARERGARCGEGEGGKEGGGAGAHQGPEAASDDVVQGGDDREAAAGVRVASLPPRHVRRLKHEPGARQDQSLAGPDVTTTRTPPWGGFRVIQLPT